MVEPTKENIENLSLRQLLSAITIKQLWAMLGAFAAIFIAAFSIGQYVSTSKLMTAESELHKIRQEQQVQMAILQFFERAFEYYRTYQINPNRWDSRQVGMKFDIVTQWMIAYAVRHIPLCRACSDVGEDGVND